MPCRTPCARMCRTASRRKAAEWDKTHHFPKAELRGLADLGCYGVAVPTEWDGAGLDYLALAIILEEIAAGDGATSTVVSVNNCPVCSILMAYGNAEQKQRFLKPLARGDMLGAFCLTEPHVGSRGRRSEDHGRLVKDSDGDALRAQRRQAVHHQRQERRRGHRHGRHRQGRRQEGHQRLHRADRHAGLHRGAHRRQDGPARQRHRADPVRATAACRPPTCWAKKAWG